MNDPSLPFASPWDWKPAKDAWYRELQDRISRWKPDPILALDVEILRAALHSECEAQSDWLYHPACGRLTLAGACRWLNDLQLVAWLVAHIKDAVGKVYVPVPAWVWRSDGGFELEAGPVSMERLRYLTRNGGESPPLALDIWGDSIGVPWPSGFDYPHDWCWGADKELNGGSHEAVRAAVEGFYRATSFLRGKNSDCFNWITDATRVVIALRVPNKGRLKSGSRSDLPGAVLFDVACEPHYLLEALVHESAHLYFYIAEAEGPLVDPAHHCRYQSPLRPDPRPLRGIFLAYHALAYMCALYSELSETVASLRLATELERLITSRDDAETILFSRRAHLTVTGNAFFDHTSTVVCHATT